VHKTTDLHSEKDYASTVSNARYMKVRDIETFFEMKYLGQ